MLVFILLAGYKSVAWNLLIWVFCHMQFHVFATQTEVKTSLDQYVMAYSAIYALKHVNDVL